MASSYCLTLPAGNRLGHGDMCNIGAGTMPLSRRQAITGALAAPMLASEHAAAQAKLKPTGQETLGPFYPMRAPTSHDTDLTHFPGRKNGRALGQMIQLTGRVLDTSGRPLPRAALTVWQANAAGRYTNPVDNNPVRPVTSDITIGDIDRFSYK